jgi:uncharacterized membrane protein YgcG
MTMNPHSPHSRQYKSLLAASLSLLSLVGLLIPSSARADITVSVDKGQDSSQKGASTPSASSSSASGGSSGGSSSGGYGGKSKGGGGGSSGKTVIGDSSSTFFTITLRNTLNTPVKGVEVEYHIYNKTTVISGGSPATNTVDDITDKVIVDLDGGGSKQVETKDVPHVVKNTTSGGGGGGGGGGRRGGGGGKGGTSAPSTTSSVQDVMGWVIYLNFKGKRVHTFTSSDTIVDQVAKYMNPQGGNGGN